MIIRENTIFSSNGYQCEGAGFGAWIKDCLLYTTETEKDIYFVAGVRVRIFESIQRHAGIEPFAELSRYRVMPGPLLAHRHEIATCKGVVSGVANKIRGIPVSFGIA